MCSSDLNQCKRGGHIVRRHDRIVKWLAGWIGERVDTETLVEQCPPGSEGGESRLDITFESGGRRLWLDVAVVTVLTTSEPDVVRRARLDGAAARQEENSKKSKYKGLATPFVLESLGRPGDIARSIIGRFASDQGLGASADVAVAWQSLSAILQAESAAHELRACGYTPTDWASFVPSF